ncbi:MAG: 3-deoxy-7-phosphoheptulonate synthase [Pirellulales bacterium]|nr:3-deoxy-7-phosphoheptulonate synthase [Pirellulales bacterium]
MIIILNSEISDSQLEDLINHVEKAGMQTHLSKGTFRTIVGLIGDESKVSGDQLRTFPGVEDVVPVLPPYKLASLEAHPQPSIVNVAGVAVGGSNLAMIAGPCSVETEERMHSIARSIKAAGANILRGGAYKPRTSPYSFQGLGPEGLEFLRDAGREVGLPTVTEITDVRNIDITAEHADVLQVGARNMQNFVLLRELGRIKRPILLKRGMSATIEDLLMSAEYVLSQGNPDVILCERGIKGFDTITRNVYDVAAVPAVKTLSHLPIIVDPSHATGKPDLIPQCAYAGIAAGPDAEHIEVHD